NQIRQLMCDNVGLVRSLAELCKAYQQLQLLAQSLSTDTRLANYDYNLEAFRKILMLATLIVVEAIVRSDGVGSGFFV
ncbi:L-aspartate oxidase, partial [Francisella tularensis subsp. holarctica]|nr:L-aspartate oxidase [Francisella tularensis subsp. holarctica]